MSIDKLYKLANPPASWRPWMGLAIFSEDGPPPPWSNNVWPAFITARARVHLWHTMSAAIRAGNRVLYCDTDSMLFQGNSRFPARARAPGDFEARGSFAQALIVGKKEYALDCGRGNWELHVKGVPFAQRREYLETGTATFARPVRIRESSRIGTPTNIWRDVTKVRRTDLRRVARSDGSLPTPCVSMDLD